MGASDWPRAISQSEVEKITLKLIAEAVEVLADLERLERRGITQAGTARAWRALAN